MIHLSWSPRAFLYKGFLTDEECEHLKEKAEAQLVKSSVVDNETGEERDSDVRTSSGTFFDKGADDVISRIEARVAQVTMLPVGASLGCGLFANKGVPVISRAKRLQGLAAPAGSSGEPAARAGQQQRRRMPCTRVSRGSVRSAPLKSCPAASLLPHPQNRQPGGAPDPEVRGRPEVRVAL